MDKQRDVFHKSMLERKVALHINQVGTQVKRNLEAKLNDIMCDKCISEGFVRSKSIRIINYSSGDIDGDKVMFTCVFECDICNPVENMYIHCSVKTVTKAGVHCEYIDSESGAIPMQIFVARDHHYNDADFNDLEDGAAIRVKVIGTRYELNDPHICVIASLLKQ